MNEEPTSDEVRVFEKELAKHEDFEKTFHSEHMNSVDTAYENCFSAIHRLSTDPTHTTLKQNVLDAQKHLDTLTKEAALVLEAYEKKVEWKNVFVYIEEHAKMLDATLTNPNTPNLNLFIKWFKRIFKVNVVVKERVGVMLYQNITGVNKYTVHELETYCQHCQDVDRSDEISKFYKEQRQAFLHAIFTRWLVYVKDSMNYFFLHEVLAENITRQDLEFQVRFLFMECIRSLMKETKGVGALQNFFAGVTNAEKLTFEKAVEIFKKVVYPFVEVEDACERLFKSAQEKTERDLHGEHFYARLHARNGPIKNADITYTTLVYTILRGLYFSSVVMLDEMIFYFHKNDIESMLKNEKERALLLFKMRLSWTDFDFPDQALLFKKAARLSKDAFFIEQVADLYTKGCFDEALYAGANFTTIKKELIEKLTSVDFNEPTLAKASTSDEEALRMNAKDLFRVGCTSWFYMLSRKQLSSIVV